MCFSLDWSGEKKHKDPLASQLSRENQDCPVGVLQMLGEIW
jgi:hypothetical protein